MINSATNGGTRKQTPTSSRASKPITRYMKRMKSAYELAMERLGASSPATKLTASQKTRLAELESVYKAKLAQEDLACREELTQLASDPDPSKAEQRRLLYLDQKRRLETELEDKKERIRAERKK